MRVADAALAGLVVAVVGLMVIPLPTWLLDILLAGNLSAAVAILLVVLYVPNALGIAVFPTLLLLTTLVRLALNVSSTRLILLQANAGEVIRSFGQFVVRGNYVVGAVVFLILTLIQFVVIAKGSERVAEVGARFVLDAMPGKQMAIDSEVRSGAIDIREARRRRDQLARESQFYGAMDGAMKFVKGDVVASVAIAAISMLGGLAIGVGQRGMPIESALKRYGLLTIGDGLVTQIPALVLATAAGILVTRVASEDSQQSLGADLAAQLLGTPRAIQVAGVFVAGLALVPGLPTVPFALLAVLFLLAARSQTRRPGAEAGAARAMRSGQHPSDDVTSAETTMDFVPMVVPWAIQISEDLAPLLQDATHHGAVVRPGITTIAQQLRRRIFDELGVPLPPAHVGLLTGLARRHAVISLFEVPARELEVEGYVEADPGAGDGQQAGVRAKEAARAIERAAYELLRRRASDYVGIAETQHLLDQVETLAPSLVRQVTPKPIPLSTLADVLRRVVEEGVSIRDLKSILEGLATVAATERDPLQLAEFVRTHLRRAITYRLTQGHAELPVFLLDASIEEAVRHAVARTPSGSFLTLAPAASRDIVTAVRRAFGPPHAADASPAAPHTGREFVLLTQPDIRRFVRKLLEPELPDLTVVSYAELLPEITLRPLGRATLVGL